MLTVDWDVQHQFKQTKEIIVVYRFRDFFAKKIYWSLHKIPLFIAEKAQGNLCMCGPGESVHVSADSSAQTHQSLYCSIHEVQIKMKAQTRFRPLASLDTTG